MEIFLIRETLTAASPEEARRHAVPYVALATRQEFTENFAFFDMGIDMDFRPQAAITAAEVNYDAVLGTFSIPDRKELTGDDHRFAFAFDEKGIVFLDDDGYVRSTLKNISRLKKWRFPSLERFLFDFLEQITADDLRLLEGFEDRLDALEERAQRADSADVPDEVAEIRGDISRLKLHYRQLQDLAQELEENENDFFAEDNLRFFSLYSNRVKALTDICTAVQEHCVQVRELQRASLDTRQNRLMSILTVVATIFMPLTLIVGWYGMNFVYMPELQYRYAYPVVIAVSVLIVVGCVIYFKKKKWL